MFSVSNYSFRFRSRDLLQIIMYQKRFQGYDASTWPCVEDVLKMEFQKNRKRRFQRILEQNRKRKRFSVENTLVLPRMTYCDWTIFYILHALIVFQRASFAYKKRKSVKDGNSMKLHTYSQCIYEAWSRIQRKSHTSLLITFNGPCRGSFYP